MLADRLKIGDTIGVIAPDKALKSKDRKSLEEATEYFESLGLKVKYGKYLFSDNEYCAGTPKQRAQDLNDMFRDTEVRAIFTVAGGELANNILPFIDFENIKNNPKIFLGMSDNTVLLCAINKMTGLVTFHCQDYIWFGKKEVADYDRNEIIAKLFNGNKVITCYEEREFYGFKNDEIEGKIYGTNAKDLLKLLGTQYMPNLEEAILFFEAYHSNIIQWNTMLEQYNQIKALNKVVVFGYIYQLQCVEENKYNIVDELRKIKQDIPIVKTNDFGHVHANSIIPIGVKVTINEKKKSIVVEQYLK
jgi:muramoyltetrapeptide carboxypeptidase